MAQFDNHTNFRGAIPPAYAYFGPVVATCLDLDVTPRFIPLREPWRNGVGEHFNDVWDKSFFRTERVAGVSTILRTENAAFAEFQQGGDPPTSCGPIRRSPRRPVEWLPGTDQLPARGRIEVVRYVRSNRFDVLPRRCVVERT